MKTLSRGCAAVAAAAIGLAAVALPAAADDITPPTGSTPVVGMAVEPGSSNLWLAGPNADKGQFVEANSGETWAFGGEPTSVQALAWSEGRLWVGDIGDANANRDYVVIFRLSAPTDGRSTYYAYDFAYDDGASRDAKAMLISGRGNIYIVTAGQNPGIYRASSNPSRERMNTLTRVADAPAGVTDGVFLTDGSTMALRTAKGIEYVDAFTWDSLVTDTIVGAPDGESIAVGQNDEIYVGGAPTIRRTQVPASDTTTTVTPEASPTPTPTTSASGSPAASASADPAGEGDQTDAGPVRTGTMIAIGLAGLLALAAGAATFFIKR